MRSLAAALAVALALPAAPGPAHAQAGGVFAMLDIYFGPRLWLESRETVVWLDDALLQAAFTFECGAGWTFAGTSLRVTDGGTPTGTGAAESLAGGTGALAVPLLTATGRMVETRPNSVRVYHEATMSASADGLYIRGGTNFSYGAALTAVTVDGDGAGSRYPPVPCGDAGLALTGATTETVTSVYPEPGTLRMTVSGTVTFTPFALVH